jgi:hypothetical protein
MPAAASHVQVTNTLPVRGGVFTTSGNRLSQHLRLVP